MAATLINPRRRGRRGYQKMTDINVTPFIDVMLVLLIVFMVTAPLIIAGTAIDLPANAAAATMTPDDSIVIVKVAPDGQITIGRQNMKVEPALLVTEVARLAGGDMAKPVVVIGAREASYSQVAAVLGPLSAAGFTGLALGKTDASADQPAAKPGAKPAAKPAAKKG